MNATLAYSLQSLSQYCVAIFLCIISLTRLAYSLRYLLLALLAIFYFKIAKYSTCGIRETTYNAGLMCN